MDTTEYIRNISGMSAAEIAKEMENLQHKLALLAAVLPLKQAERAEEPGEHSDPSLPVRGSATITENDVRYGLMRFPASSELAGLLTKGSEITVCWNGNHYPCSVPKLANYPNQKGRINGLKKVFSASDVFRAGARIDATYDAGRKRLTIEAVE